MISNATDMRVEDTAHHLFDVITHFCLAAPRGRRRVGDLKEVEFLTLAILQQHSRMIVGDIQRLLGVLPAQMSRIIRSLESRERPYIQCQINPHDKRKIDVCLTPAGEKALFQYRTIRIQGITESLRTLSDEEHEELGRLVERIQAALERQGHGIQDGAIRQ